MRSLPYGLKSSLVAVILVFQYRERHQRTISMVRQVCFIYLSIKVGYSLMLATFWAYKLNCP